MAQLAVKLESVKSISLNVQIRAIYKQNKTKRKKKETALRKEIDSWTKVLSIFFFFFVHGFTLQPLWVFIVDTLNS